MGYKKKAKKIYEEMQPLITEFEELYAWYKEERKKFEEERLKKFNMYKKAAPIGSNLKFERVIIERQEVL